MTYTLFRDLAQEAVPPQDGILSRTVFQDDKVKVVLFGFAVGQELSEHTAAKPIMPDNTTMPPQGTAGTQQNANNKVADAKEREQAAAADVKTKEQEFQATQERDNFVKQAEQKLGDYDKRIDELNQQASNAQAANKDAINRQIDAVKSSRDRAKKALDDLKGADVMAWKNHQDHVRMAFQELDNTVKNVR